ncbi:hypothetical protein [Streptomyces ficellus]|uniref:Proteophosphoglycan 5 n=1 Tax=Streptomyces ficellus TaxID=1977088 RepID=A0A6I6F365_9ACTN|nr:hypothetical protein [Streptomyces ficellus]QGV77054.1 hypothetical protein EIZ62_01375 [Streptomyces ficellus]
MAIHRPGRPEDLPPGEELWARWALLAAVEATTEEERRPSGHRTGRWIDDEGLHYDDSGCTWWTMSRMGEGRFVLYGEDESSGVKWYEPPIDMLAGGPDWLPYGELRDRLKGYELGCVYWYDNGTWARAPYPGDLGDDGLDCGISGFADRDHVLGELSDRVDDSGGDCVDDSGGGLDADALLAAAEAHRLAPASLLERLRPVYEDEPLDLPAVARALALAGITGREPNEGAAT